MIAIYTAMRFLSLSGTLITFTGHQRTIRGLIDGSMEGCTLPSLYSQYQNPQLPNNSL